MSITFTATKMALSHAFGASKVFLVKHAPEILLVTGIALTTGALVYSNIVTAKKLPVAKEKYVKACTDIRANDPDGDTRKAITKETGKFVGECAKMYAVPAAMYGAGVFCGIKSHCILTTRCDALVAALAAAAAKSDTATEEATEEPKVEEPKSVPGLDYLFDENTCKVWHHYDAAERLSFLYGTEEGLTLRLRSRGYLFLNEALEAMRMDPVPEGQTWGWVDKDHTAVVDFGINMNMDEMKAYLEDGNAGVWLHPNCTGCIVDNFTTFQKK